MAETIDGVLQKILWHKPDRFHDSGSKFLVGRLTNGQTVKGYLSLPKEGESYRFWGEFRPQKKYPDPAFEFTSCEIIVDQSIDGVAGYLRRYIDGLGYSKSEAIVDHFGTETLTILRSDPDRALEVRGITPKIVEAIREHFDTIGHVNPAVEAQLTEMLARHRMPRTIVDRLIKLFPNDAVERLTKNPYILRAYPRIGWKTVDAFALSEVQFDPAGIERHAAAIDEAFMILSRQGHTCVTMAEIDSEIRPLIGSSACKEAWSLLGEKGQIRAFQPEANGARMVALSKFANAENTIADKLRTLSDRAIPLPIRLGCDGLGDEQQAAVRLIQDHGVVILSGAPGTGKSFTICKVIADLVAGGINPSDILYVAPTGKAAKRGTELLNQHLPDGVDVTCSTIHRALAPVPGMAPEGVSSKDAKIGRGRDALTFSKNEGSPILAKIIIADEASMVDVSLAASFLKAIAPGSRLILVGDENQLPSVGPGAVLRDLVAGGIPSITLREIRRSESAGRVVHACHAIRDGRTPQPAEVANPPVDNWIHIELDDPDEIARTIVELHGATRFDPIWDTQVVSPQKDKHPFSCNPLNFRLAAKLNPLAAEFIADRESSEDPDNSFWPPFFVGDKVVRIENGECDLMAEIDPDDEDYERIDWEWRGHPYRIVESYIVNGDMGTVLDLVDIDDEAYVVVQFRNPDRLVRLPRSNAKLIQAYAMTAHRCQGSGFPFVIIPVHHAFYWDARKQVGLFNREWIYTAISRAEQMLVTVGQFSAIRAAISRKTVHLRKTKLASLLGDFGTVAREATQRRAGGQSSGQSLPPANPTTLALPAPTPPAIGYDGSADGSPGESAA